MKKSIFTKSVLWMGLFSLGGACVFADELKIGTVDMQKALQTVDAGKKAKNELEKEFNAKKKSLQTEENALKKMSEDFKKQSLAMNEEARNRKQAELQERIMKFQEMTAKSQSEITQKQHDLTEPLVVKLKSTIGDIAKKKTYTIVLEKNENSVLYSLDKDDITDEVISTFDKSNKSSD